MSTALTVFLVLVTVLLVLAVAIALVVTVWVGRHVARAGRVAGRGVRTGRARVQASLPGPAQEVHAQRLRVERERAATASAWSEARRAGRRSVRELAPHQPVLEATGRRLANDLAIVAAEPDDWRRRAWLAEVRPAVDAYVRACGQFRQGVLLVGDAYGDGAFSLTATALSELVAREHERVTGYRDIGVLDVQAVPGGSAGSGVSLSKAPVVR